MKKVKIATRLRMNPATVGYGFKKFDAPCRYLDRFFYTRLLFK